MGERKRPLVPRLRFPEFREMGEWEEKKIGQIADLYKGKGISKSDIVVGGVQPCIRYGELYTLYGEVINNVISKTNISASDLFLSNGNDVIIPASGETKIDIATASCVIHDNIALGGDLNVIRSNQNGIFLSYYLNGTLRNKIAKVAQGDTVVHLYPSQLQLIDLAIPSEQEQQKIADCLSSLDDLISAQNQKVEALKRYKKGLMQQLFPAEGETVPRLRFPEFREMGDWKSKLMGELYSFKGNNSFSRDNLNYDQGTVKNIHYGDIHTKFSPLFDIYKENVPFINSEESIEKIDSENYCLEGDMVFADASEDLADVGKSIELINLNDERVLSGLHTILARQKNTDLIVGFGGHLFQSTSIRNQIRRESQGTKVLSLSATRLAKIQVFYPTRKDEQQKIADCLSSLDDLISAQNQKVDALKRYKKGLMQQLFPVLDEASA